MFYLDPRITSSVTTAVILLNDSRDRFDWLDQTPGAPVYVFSESQGGWYNCVSAVDGRYEATSCFEADKPSTTDPELKFLPRPKRGREEEPSGPEASNRTVEMPAGLWARREQEEKADAVLAWANTHLDFSKSFKVSPWGKNLDGTQIHVIGPSLRRRLPAGVPSLPSLTDEAFLSRLATLGVPEGLATTHRGKRSHYFVLTSEGMDFVFDNFVSKAPNAQELSQ